MTPQEHNIRLDEAIDRVAARLTCIDDDPMLAARIVAALPDRVRWSGWLFHSWAPRLALLAIIVTAGMLWRNTRVALVEPTPLQAASTPAVVTRFAAVVDPEPNRTKPLEPLELVQPLEPAKPDFDRSLAAMVVPDAPSISPLAPRELASQTPLEVESLEIAVLPLTESSSPR